MPQINRIRVNNIKYNFGTQFYDDFVMRFSCRNSLYDLANGGGKSVLMLLLMQNLIPNCTLDDKQPIEKLFRSGNDNTVIHSLVEWKLDTCDMRDGFRYMTTGFCARKAKDGGDEERRDTENASIEYFNYCIFYKEFGENDIKNLPLVSNGERISYGGLKTYLRNLEKRDSGLEIRIFDRKGDYQNFIGEYGLYESQWEIVRGINRTEGHVRAYFESNYKTTRRIIEDLLIEEIIEKSYNNRIRRGESDDEEMAQTLLDIKDKLIELARRREEIHNYDTQTELLTGFGGGLEELRALYADKRKAQNSLINCLIACKSMLAAQKSEAQALAADGEKLDADYREAARTAALAELETEFARLDGVLELIAEASASHDALETTKEELSERLALSEAAADYADYIEYKHKYDEIKELLNSGNIGKKELLEELSALAAAKLEYVEKESAGLEEEARLAKDAADAAKAESERAKEEEQALFAEINSCKGMETELSDRKEKADAELELLMQGLGILTADDAGRLLEENREQSDAANIKIADLERAIEQGRVKQLELGRRQAELSALVSYTENEIKRLEDALSEALEAEQKQSRLMEIYGVSDGAMLAETVEYVYTGLTGEKIAAKKEHDRLASYRSDIKKQSLPAYDAGFEAVLSYLKGRYGDGIQSGREFIESMTKEDAAKAVSDFPQLPYVILAGAEYETVANDKVLTAINTGSYVIPIVPADSWRDGIKYAAAYKNMSFLWDGAALTAELEKTGEDIAVLEESIKKLEGKCEVARNDLTAAQLLRNAESPALVREKIFQAKNRISSYNERLDALYEESAECETGISKLKENLDGERRGLDELKRVSHIYSRINEQNGAAETAAAQLFDTVQRRKKAEKDYGLVKARLEESLRRAEENSVKAREAGARLAGLRQDFADNFRQYLTDEAKPVRDMTQEQIDARAGALRSLLNDGNGDAADKEKLLAEYEASMQKCAQKLLYAGFGIDEAEKLYKEGRLIKGSVDELLELKAEISALETKLAKLKASLDERNADKNRIEGGIAHGRRRYEEQFGNFTRQNMENPQNTLLKYRREMSVIKGCRTDLDRKVKELERSGRDGLLMEKDLERLVRNAGLAVPKLSEAEAVGDGVKLTPEAYEEVWRGYERILAEENRLKTKFYKDKQALAEELDKCRAYELAQEIRAGVELPADTQEIDELLKGLSDTNECILLEKDRIEKTVGDMERIKDSFENRCVQICANIRTELDRFPKLSRITLDGEVVPIVTLAVPYIKEEIYKERMSVYINETVSGAETFEDRESKLKYIRGRLSWKKLFSVIVTDMNSIKLCLYKREHIKDQSRYLRYEEAVGSTGQSQGIYIQFLIAIINYIASINASGKDTSVTGKTIFIDNPFGAAKDVYIWEPIFGMLATNHVQLIVPARGVTPAITRMFDVNYILGQKFVSGRQQTVVADYRSQVQAGEMDYTRLEFEQATFDFV